MNRGTPHFLLLTLIASAHPIGAQLPVAAPTQSVVTAIPKTPAGEALREWLDAFNSADSARIAAYFRRYEPDEPSDGELGFREQTGGFDLLSIERSEPRHLEFMVRERNSPMTAYGLLDVSSTEPVRVKTRRLQAIGPNATAAALQIDAIARARAVAGAAALLDTFYVFPDVARRMGDSLRARLARKEYDRYANGVTFATRLDDDLAELSHDKHLHVNYSALAMPPEPSRPVGAPPPAPSPEDQAREREFLDRINCGFVKAEHLPGNIGYLKFNMFADTAQCGTTAAAAMTFLAGTRALIIDLRENGGGSPGMVAFVSSYLFDRRTHLNDLWTRRTNKTEEFWTRDSVSGRRFGGQKPVYVLTSARTFSGAEEFTNNLKTLKRATIVGETTGGGAHPVSGHRIDEHFMIGVPFARAINPVTHTNWEGVGVKPDVIVPASEALSTAEKMLREKLRQ
ncbi:MAG: retinol-binding protein 3 [Gemmatimonadaceae bacterium]|nr:retinol-binding protein 3 [Gemmatimonadaceae bacterium]